LFEIEIPHFFKFVAPQQFFRLDTDIMRYTKLCWDELQVDHLSREAPDWDKRKEKIVEAMTSSTEIFRQYKHANGQLMKLWKLLDETTVTKTTKKGQIIKFSVATETLEKDPTTRA